MARRTEITEETPTETLLALHTPKPFMLQLAQKVFNTTSGKLLHAFIQFDIQSLARVIDAKRSGVWDFGKYINLMENGKGYEYPNKADALRMLHEAEERVAPEPEISGVPDEPEQDEASTSSEESMDTIEQRRAELEAMKKRPLQRLHLEVTGNRSKQGEDAKYLVERILAVEFAISQRSGRDSPYMEPTAPSGPTVVINTVSAETEDAPSGEVVTLPTPEEGCRSHHVEEEAPSIEVVPDDEPDVLEKPVSVLQERDLEADVKLDDMVVLLDQTQRIITGLRGMFALLDVVQRRQNVLAGHILEHGVQSREWVEVPDGLVHDFDVLVAGLLGDQEEEPSLHVEEEVPSNGGQPGVGVAMESEEQLRSMTLQQLQNYADTLGIPDAHAQAIQPILLRQVMHKQKKLQA